MDVDILVFDGVDELDAVGPLEVFRTAALAGAPITSRLVALREPLDVIGAHGLRFTADGLYQPGADVLLVPGGGWLARSGAGTWAEAERDDILPLLAKAAAGATVMAGVCTGVMLLARAGIVGGRRATTHHGAHEELAATGATVVTDRVVDDGDLVTCGGVTSGLDLALHLVARFAGPAVARAVAEDMNYPWPAAPGLAPFPPAESREPAHQIATDATDRLVRAVFAGTVVAETRRALVLREASMAPVYYLPAEDVRTELFTPTDLHTTCPFKGEASYWSVEVDGRRGENIAWSYETPNPGREDITGRLAFFTSRLDALEVEA